jgi:hypothetical protein
MSERKAGELLDALNVCLDMEDTDMVTDVVVIAKNVMADGGVSLIVGKSESTSWLEQLGLIYAASDIMRQTNFERPGD